MDEKGFVSRIYLTIMTFIYSVIGKLHTLYIGDQPAKKVDSLIVTDSDIKILNDVNDVDENNLLNYLRHHILYTDDKFDTIYLDEPLFVKFKYLNETYQICLRKLESTKDDHTHIVSTPKYLSAIVSGETDVTQTIKEFHGHTKNFFKHIPDTVNDLPIILKEHTGNKLETFDMMGKQEIHEL